MSKKKQQKEQPKKKEEQIIIKLSLEKSATMFKLEYLNQQLEQALSTATQLVAKIAEL